MDRRRKRGKNDWKRILQGSGYVRANPCRIIFSPNIHQGEDELGDIFDQEHKLKMLHLFLSCIVD